MTPFGGVPDDNPIGGSRIYARGIRNSFGMAFDPGSRRLWETENGPSATTNSTGSSPAGIWDGDHRRPAPARRRETRIRMGRGRCSRNDGSNLRSLPPASPSAASAASGQ